MFYDQKYIELAREQGAPDPERNAAIGNRIIDLLQADMARYHRYRPETLKQVSHLLDQLTDPLMRQGIEELIEFDTTCICMPRD